MQPKNKPLKRRKYDATFKADVLKMIANGQSVPYVAQALGISEALIYNRWYYLEICFSRQYQRFETAKLPSIVLIILMALFTGPSC